MVPVCVVHACLGGMEGPGLMPGHTVGRHMAVVPLLWVRTGVFTAVLSVRAQDVGVIVCRCVGSSVCPVLRAPDGCLGSLWVG